LKRLRIGTKSTISRAANWARKGLSVSVPRDVVVSVGVVVNVGVSVDSNTLATH